MTRAAPDASAAAVTDASRHARRAVEAVWREQSARIVAGLTRQTGDFSWAEDLAQEALVEALDRWPSTGIPPNPGAWLMTVARRRAIDGWRRRDRLAARAPLLAVDVREAEAGDPVPEGADPDAIGDDVLRLVFVACHPVLPAQARLALTLRTVAGMTTEQIARVLLMTQLSVQQRIVRSPETKRKANGCGVAQRPSPARAIREPEGGFARWSSSPHPGARWRIKTSPVVE